MKLPTTFFSFISISVKEDPESHVVNTFNFANCDLAFALGEVRSYYDDSNIVKIDCEVRMLGYIRDTFKLGSFTKPDHKTLPEANDKSNESYKNLRALKSKVIASCMADGVSLAELSELLSPPRGDNRRAILRLSRQTSKKMHEILRDEFPGIQACTDTPVVASESKKGSRKHRQNVFQTKDGQGTHNSRKCGN